MGIDTWGVDFGFLDRSGDLLSLPRSYRDDAFNEENMAEAIAFLGGESLIFRETYLANLVYNPLFKLYRMRKEGAPLEAASTLLMLPNLFEYFLTGIRRSEYTAAATSQLYNMKRRVWSRPLLDKLGLPASLFTEVETAGTVIGPLSAGVERETGRKLQLVSVAGHDTASAVMAAPARGREFLFLSSGTWSLMGFCSSRLLEDEHTAAAKISNEGCWDGSCRPTVNISGLWILQECLKQWAAAGMNYSFDELDSLALQEPALQSLIRPGDFEKIGDYPRMIRDYCKKTNQNIPAGTGGIVRCILESLALKYRQVYELFKPYVKSDAVYVVGGGVRNRLLNRFTACALGLPVITGPAEAAAAGNVLIQLEALGELRGAEERSAVVEASFKSETFLPEDREIWDEAYGRFLALYES
jgi:sugar (pentulose or hexulose) kinase